MSNNITMRDDPPPYAKWLAKLRTTHMIMSFTHFWTIFAFSLVSGLIIGNWWGQEQEIIVNEYVLPEGFQSIRIDDDYREIRWEENGIEKIVSIDFSISATATFKKLMEKTQ